MASALGNAANASGGVVTSPVGNANLAAGTAAANLGFTPLNPANNLSDVSNVAAARANLGITSGSTPNMTIYAKHSDLTSSATTPSTPTSVIAQEGYYASGDGGWAEFDWNPLSTAAADGNLVVLPNGQSSATPSRYMIRKDSGMSLRADAFGAVGDYQTFGDGALTSGQNTLASNQATFTAGDVGKPIWVFYGGASTTIAAPAQPTVLTPGGNSTMSSDTAVCYPRGSLASQTYYLRLTYVGSGGETTGSTEQAVACGSSTIVEVSSPLPSYGAVGYNVYISTTSGSGWTLQNDYPLYIGHPWFMPTAGLRSGGSALPGSNTTVFFVCLAVASEGHRPVILAPQAHQPHHLRDLRAPGPSSAAKTADALGKIWREVEAGHEWIVDADLKGYFGSVDHEKLMALIGKQVADGRVLKLIRQTLAAGYEEKG